MAHSLPGHLRGTLENINRAIGQGKLKIYTGARIIYTANNKRILAAGIISRLASGILCAAGSIPFPANQFILSDRFYCFRLASIIMPYALIPPCFPVNIFIYFLVNCTLDTFTIVGFSCTLKTYLRHTGNERQTRKGKAVQRRGALCAEGGKRQSLQGGGLPQETGPCLSEAKFIRTVHAVSGRWREARHRYHNQTGRGKGISPPYIMRRDRTYTVCVKGGTHTGTVKQKAREAARRAFNT